MGRSPLLPPPCFFLPSRQMLRFQASSGSSSWVSAISETGAWACRALCSTKTSRPIYWATTTVVPLWTAARSSSWRGWSATPLSQTTIFLRFWIQPAKQLLHPLPLPPPLWWSISLSLRRVSMELVWDSFCSLRAIARSLSSRADLARSKSTTAQSLLCLMSLESLKIAFASLFEITSSRSTFDPFFSPQPPS